MAIKYQAIGPHGWSVSVIIGNGKAIDMMTCGEGLDAKMYVYEERALTAPELRLVELSLKTTDLNRG